MMITIDSIYLCLVALRTNVCEFKSARIFNFKTFKKTFLLACQWTLSRISGGDGSNCNFRNRKLLILRVWCPLKCMVQGYSYGVQESDRFCANFSANVDNGLKKYVI